MLALRPGCACCDRDLFECTFCRDCELVVRPRRPAALLAKYPASTERVFKPVGCGRAAG